MLILIELRPLYHFCGRVSPEKRNFWEHFPNFQVQFVPWIWHHRNMKYRNGRTYFVVISENVVNFDEAPWESAAFTNLFSRSQNDYFENRSIFFASWLQRKRTCSNYHSMYSPFQPWHNTVGLRVGLQWEIPKSDVAHTSMNLPFLDFLAFCGVLWRIWWSHQ